MKILCVIDSLGPGGSQRQLVELAIGFKEKGNEVSFLTYHNNPFYYKDLRNAGISLRYVEISNYLFRMLIIRRIIRSRSYDVVLSFLEGPSFICEFARLPYSKWRLIVGERSAISNIYKIPKLLIYRLMHLIADFIVANSNKNIALVLKVNPFLSRSKCKVIYNSIDFVRWYPPKDFDFKVNGLLNLVVAASHRFVKNLNGLIEALQLMDQKQKDMIRIAWYGDRITEPFYDESFMIGKTKIKNYGLEKIITFHPATSNITEIIQNADAVGLFSLYEGLPNIVCEGMACGKTLICSMVSDLPEFLAHDLKLLFDPQSPESIKNSLEYLISLSKEQLYQTGIRNHKIALQYFNKDNIISSYLRLMNTD